jgi:uncharacterized phage protein (TIGR02218 family)
MPETATDSVTSLAMCWRVERSDGAGIALTSHDSAVLFDGDRCTPTPGMMPASVTRQLGLEPHAGEVAGALSTEAMTYDDLLTGRWNGARVALSAVDWKDAEVSPITLLAGNLGAVSVVDAQFTAELEGASTKLERPVCPSTSADCRATFGDPQCRVDLAGRSIMTRVTIAETVRLSIEASVDERFILGRLRYLSGANTGLTTTIIAVEASGVVVRDVPPAPVEADCRVELREGCDKSFATCAGRFGNAANFRGEPHLPGTDLLTRYPGV